MNNTNQAAIDAAIKGVTASQQAQDEARQNEQRAAAATRQAENSYQLACDGRPGDPVGQAAVIEARRIDWERARDSHQAAKLAVTVAETDVKAAEARLESEKLKPLLPVAPTREEMDIGLEEGKAVFMAARDAEARARAAVEEIENRIKGLEPRRLAILNDRAAIAKKGESLAALSGEREALGHDLDQARAELADAEATSRVAARKLLGDINPRVAEMQSKVRSACASFQKTTSQLPVYRLCGAIENRGNMLGTPDAPGYAQGVHHFLEIWEALVEPVEKELAAMDDLQAVIRKRLTESGAAVDSAIEATR